MALKKYEKIVNNREALAEIFIIAWKIIKSGDGPIYVCVEIYKRITDKQLRYYWGAILPTILDHLKEFNQEDFGRFNKEQLDFVMRRKFYYDEIIDPFTGEIIIMPRRLSMTKANREEVIAYFDALIHYAASKLGIEIMSGEEYEHKLRCGIDSGAS